MPRLRGLEKLILWLYLAVPSLGIVYHTAGIFRHRWAVPAVVGYLALSFLATWIAALLVPRCSGKTATYLCIGLFVAIAVLVVATKPLAHSRGFGHFSSDRGEALNLATAALVRGQFPYHQRTSLGNPISPLPGALALATPFVVALGDSAWQNLFWIALLLLTAGRLAGPPKAATLEVVLLLLCPAALHDLFTGGDYLANAVYVTLAVCWVCKTARERSLLPAAFLGLALSSRASYGLILPLVAGWIWRESGWRPATRRLGVALATFAAVTLPVYVWDPAGFSPLQTLRRTGPSSLLSALLIGGVLCFSAWSAMRTTSLQLTALLTCAALVLTIPVITLELFHTLRAGTTDFLDLVYGLSATVPAALGAVLRIDGRASGGAGARHEIGPRDGPCA